jgi:hypothetical protein
MFDLIIRSGDVVTPERVVRCDVAVAGETIAAIATPGTLSAESAKHLIDATGHIVMPGGIDPHVHLHHVWIKPDGTPLVTAGPEQVGRAALFGGTTSSPNNRTSTCASTTSPSSARTPIPITVSRSQTSPAPSPPRPASMRRSRGQGRQLGPAKGLEVRSLLLASHIRIFWRGSWNGRPRHEFCCCGESPFLSHSNCLAPLHSNYFGPASAGPLRPTTPASEGPLLFTRGSVA